MHEEGFLFNFPGGKAVPLTFFCAVEELVLAPAVYALYNHAGRQLHCLCLCHRGTLPLASFWSRVLLGQPFAVVCPNLFLSLSE